ncbi:nicotinate-nucleotide adenylyltransferase [Conexibacter stalactiti]|uniref:Probable nicotinate-nucleotide adenylyltransferase n=1 Tax=Conexibacter stalactiti TaxID=1940611 RepID=A0ABU4HQY8_9ACTN|nr:nicotinate-nucleotide adenylyltransferase [Conexibacter stalactiti]MDW5595650.1 nicotinate-nucleotide adenylyltransferase [Conexibacter stalactiti]MEC5036292.1 nicotinate-nucleotide adenylyltransferase [Conexibacter stalactiti]
MRVGILGGTFNPPHLAHLVCAQEAHAQLGLDRIVLMPAGEPPHKQLSAGDPSPDTRYELCLAAVRSDERFVVSRAELDRPGRSYTVDTLRLLRERDPQDELTFIVGGDMAASLPSWREPEAVLGLATLAVAERVGAKREAIERELAPLAGAGRVTFFDMPRIDVSSSLVRERVAAARPIRYLVPDAVAEAIDRNGLYRAAGEVTT